MRTALIVLMILTALGMIPNVALWVLLCSVPKSNFHDQGGMAITFGMVFTLNVIACTSVPCLITGLIASGRQAKSPTRRLGAWAMGLGLFSISLTILLIVLFCAGA